MAEQAAAAHMHKVVRPHLPQARCQLPHQVLRCWLGQALDGAQQVRQVAAGTVLHDQVQPVRLLQNGKGAVEGQ